MLQIDFDTRGQRCESSGNVPEVAAYVTRLGGGVTIVQDRAPLQL